MEIVEAIALDNKHLELKRPLSADIGKRLYIQVLSPQMERSHQLRQLKEAYLTMTEKEKELESNLAEEGLRAQSTLGDQFPEEEDNWWE